MSSLSRTKSRSPLSQPFSQNCFRKKLLYRRGGNRKTSPHDYYLRALPQFYLATPEGLAEAIGLAHRALELDPRFGLVAALAGVCHVQNVIWGYANDPQFDRKEAVRLSRLALSVDDDDPQTLAAAALISAFMVGDSEGEIEMADRAVALNPNTFGAWGCRGHVYRIAGCRRKRCGALNGPFA